MQKLLNFEIFGDKNEKIVVIAHGLFGSLKNWRSVAKYLAELGFKVVNVDLRNHGNSFWDGSQSYEDMAADLSQVINKFGNAVDMVGHSMGGKAAMVLALLYPNLVKRLIVIDIAPVKYDHNQLRYIKAMKSINLNLLRTRKELLEQLAGDVPDLSLRAFLSQSVDFSDRSNLKWRLNLESLEKNLSSIMDFPRIELTNLIPTLVIRGDLSNYVLDDQFPVYKKYFPNYKIFTIENAGHWLHSERRSIFETQLSKFLCV